MLKFKNLLTMLIAFMAAASAWAYDSVTSLPKGQENKMSYVLSTPRGELYCNKAVASDNLLSTIKHSATSTTNDSKFQFLLFQSKAETAGYYIYNVSLGKFVGTFSGNDVIMADAPTLWYIFETGKTDTNQDNQVNSTRFNCADYPYCISSLDGEVNRSGLAVSNWDCTYGTRVSGSSWDGGNQYCIAEAEVVTESVWKAAYDKVVAYESNVTPDPGTGGGTDVEIDPTKVLNAAERAKQENAAMDIINRFTRGEMQVEVILDLARTTGDCDSYSYSATADKLTVHASSAVAACRGFYDYIKAKGAGFCSWSGNRFVKPADMSCDEVSVTTAFRDHQYFNVVTYGYSLPYWDKERWRQELDWMALHGFDMPLMLVGSEAIYRKVFKDMGLTDAQVDEWEVGPAHLPWFRMGNLAGNSFDGPLGDEWNENQRQLAHYLLDEMDKLGMKPICPAFGGFVPKAFKNVVGGTYSQVGWNWCQSKGVPNYRLNPSSKEFVEVGTRFIKAWEKEYGMCKYYLSDSFNEMTIPSSTATLTQYGDSIYKTITEGSMNPEAVWVTQGWTFVWQVEDWGKTKFDALTKNVDPKRFLTLYMSPEYAEIKGRSKVFETYYASNKTEWNCTYLTNMGGKNIWTGNLQKYCYTYPRELSLSTRKGNLSGYGMTMEGIECNEMLNECIADAGWTNEGGILAAQASQWMEDYANARYGAYPDEIKEYFKALKSSVYNSYIDAPRFGWQAANLGITGGGNVTLSSTFTKGVETLFEHTDVLKENNTPLLESELIEAVAQYVGNKISSKICTQIKNAKSDKTRCQQLIDELEDLMLNLDAALELHPIHNLKRWEDLAQKGYVKDAKRNAENARRILTVWYGNHTEDEPVQDYATRIWAGLMRDYFCPRLVKQLQKECGLISSFNRIKFENDFVKSAPVLSDPRSVEGDHIDFLAMLVDAAKNFGVEKKEDGDLKPSKQKMKIIAVFPNGSEHTVYSDGQRFTAADEVPEDAVSEFGIAHMDGNSYVLKAGEQFIHWTSGDNAAKSEDLDGLNEEFDAELNFLTIKLGDEEGLQSTTWDKAPITSLYEVIGNGSNGQPFNFTLREKDDEWIAGDSGMKFFDNNWDGIGCRTSFFRIEFIEPEGPIFAINFDEDAEPTRAPERQITYIALTEEGGTEQRFDVSGEKVYSDLTETAVFEVKEGATVSGVIGYNGNWMHGYFYIDVDGDRSLTYNIDNIDQTGTEVFSYSFWSGDLSQEQSGQNSLGQTLTGNSRNTVVNNSIALPAFKAPAAGEYKVRFKIDWNSVEPAGSSVQDIIANGGYIVDAVLRVGDVTGIATIGDLTDTVDRALHGEATIDEINSVADRILLIDLQGRRVSKLSKGVTIVNGRKVVL